MKQNTELNVVRLSITANRRLPESAIGRKHKSIAAAANGCVFGVGNYEEQYTLSGRCRK